MAAIELQRTNKQETRVDFEFTYPSSVSAIFDESAFSFEYNTGIDGVPDPLLNIPFVANVAPIAWISGTDLLVPTLDSEFASSLSTLRSIYADFYPEIGFDAHPCSVKTRTVQTSSSATNGENAAALFTGGVDSLTTYIRHRDKSPRLIKITRGESLTHSDEDRTTKQIQEFAARENVDYHLIHSNYRGAIDKGYLKYNYVDSFQNWWDIHHGISLLGMCAPLSAAANIDNIYIASSHTDDFDHPWGSHPRIDNELSWNSTNCIHDGYELTRQEKWELIVDTYASAEDEVLVQSCPVPGNCSSCFKCARNIVGGTLAGADPENYGYGLSDSTYDEIREKITGGEWEFDPNERFFWDDIQESIPENPENEQTIPENVEWFFEWLREVDFEQYEQKTGVKTETERKFKIYYELKQRSPLLANLVRQLYYLQPFPVQ
jgi:hypothetical protein